MRKIFILILLFLLSGWGFAQQTVTINNLKPRVDMEGNPIDAHDGRVIKFGSKFYWYGTAYEDASGFSRSNYFQCYSSDDLMSWKKEGKLLENQPSGYYFRPHVIYNKKTQKYVLWYNWYPVLWDGKFGVAVSDTPEGPFQRIGTDVQVVNSKDGVGDLGLFVDDDETAYLLYNTIDGHKGSIEKLSADYLESTFESSGILMQGCEAGAIFKRDGKYYFLTDWTCCFCSEGTGARVYVSDHPMKGYELKNNINKHPGTPAPALIDGIVTPHLYSTVQRQEDGSFSPIQIILQGEDRLSRLQIYQYTGNRPRSYCGDTLSVKHYYDIVTPAFELFAEEHGKWVETPAQTRIEATSIYNIITLSFDIQFPKALLLQIADSYPYDEISFNEIKLFDDTKQITASNNKVLAFINDDNPKWLPVIPAQQTYVMPLKTTNGMEYIWMGDLWGSAPDNIKGHDQQYWGAPLVFDANGNIEPMVWVDEWQTTITD